jgi:hypothetical protein
VLAVRRQREAGRLAAQQSGAAPPPPDWPASPGQAGREPAAPGAARPERSVSGDFAPPV